MPPVYTVYFISAEIILSNHAKYCSDFHKFPAGFSEMSSNFSASIIIVGILLLPKISPQKDVFHLQASLLAVILSLWFFALHFHGLEL